MKNKTLVALLALALVVTVMGTLVSVSKLGPQNGFSFLTAAATSSASGTSYVNITSATSITNDVSSVDFGQGYVDSSGTNCTTDSRGNVTSNGAYCIGFNTVTQGFLIENTGNVNVSVNMTCTGNCTAAQFIGGSNPTFRFSVQNNDLRAIDAEIGALDTQPSCDAAKFGAGLLYTGITTWTDVSTSNVGLCGQDHAGNYTLDFTDSQDAFAVDIAISIPVDAPSMNNIARAATFTFSAVSAG